ncbi:hypothetical protein [Aureibacter tunicatorum]|uniref:Uncharacterized protein n=1 Tax=Aureibacter tunicatorum TaxID=866807 RepID=A0AAE4BRA3_9BACT|nr:hypothetical protein [Aureibacter tunicatorum]MDR6237042.1 hypothetical protein [Aureibacter tunicatorum]BDD06034.1 hypothetical protein AUTU_35170 [Aureibacter tunicatorum]
MHDIVSRAVIRGVSRRKNFLIIQRYLQKYHQLDVPLHMLIRRASYLQAVCHSSAFLSHK